MSNFTITIEAPEICEAIKALASALLNAKLPVPAPQIQTPAQVLPSIPAAAPSPVPTTAAPITPVTTPQQTSPQTPPPVIPTTTPTYTSDQLAIAATQLMDAGRKNDLINLLKSFDVAALTQLPKEKYGAFATALRELGAKI